MLSPATPLTLALLIAFTLLLLSTLSTPVIKSIPLGQIGKNTYGVLGFCSTSDGSCSGPRIGFDISSSNNVSEPLSASSRTKLSTILVVHPIAAFFILICTILAGTAHFPAAGHNPQYLLALLILTFPTLLVTLLAFLVDILLFVPPQLKWGGWIVLPAVLIITACSVVTCAMRRTLVNRMARKERIAKNEDMNGSTYYEMKAQTEFRPLEPQYRAPEAQYARAESPPPLDSNVTAIDANKTPQFSSFERRSTDNRSLPNGRDPSVRTNGSGSRRRGELSGSTMAGSGLEDGQYDEYGPPRRSSESRGRGPRGPMPYGRGGPPLPGYSRPREGYPPQRGPRGGYYPPRGSYGRGRGPPPGWNGYGRGGPMMGRGRPGPPPGYPSGYARGPPPPSMGPDGMMMYSRPNRSNSAGTNPPTVDQTRALWTGQEDNYEDPDMANWENNYVDDYREGDAVGENPVPVHDTRPSTGSSITRDPASFGFSGRQPSPGSRSQTGLSHTASPPPVPQMPQISAVPGQAVVLDAATGSPAETLTAVHSGWDATRDEVGGHVSPSSQYDTQAGIPTTTNTETQALELQHSNNSRARPSSEAYYEDIEPRFSEGGDRPTVPIAAAVSSPPPPHFEIDEPREPEHQMHSSFPPRSYTHGRNQPQDPNTLYPVDPASRDDSHSPALSDEGSNFTSISQRSVNPNWQPDPASYTHTRWREQEQILNNNPDFVLPGAGPSRHHRNNSRGVNSPIGGYPGASRYPDPA